MENEKITYTEAKTELEKIVALIDSDELDVDQLGKHVKRASELVAFCKQKLMETDEELQKILEDLKFHLAKEKIAKGNDIKVEKEEVEAFAAEVASAQFAQYGMNNLTGEMLDNYVHSLLEDENTHRNMYEQVIENKVREWIKENAKIKEEEILSKDLDQMLVDMDAPEEEIAEETVEAVAEEIAGEVEEKNEDTSEE